MDSKFVSIIVGEYNSESFIEKNVRSLLNQTYKNIEILLYDDASTDSTREIMKKMQTEFPDKIRIFYSDENKGVGYGRNYCLHQAKGEYILFMDHDDYIHDSYVERVLKFAEKNPKYDIVYTGFTSVDDTGKIRYIRRFKNKEMALRQSIPLFAKLYKRQFLIKNQLKSCEGRVIEDILYQGGLEISTPNIIVYDYPFYYYVFNRKSIKNTVFLKFQEGILEKSYKYLKGIKQKKALTQEQKQVISYYSFYFTCWYLLKTGAYVKEEDMNQEYLKAIKVLEDDFCEFIHNPYISLFRPKGSKVLVRGVLFFIYALYRMRLLGYFFRFYAKKGAFFRKLWPEL